MKRTAVAIAILNWSMLAGLALSVALFGDRSGAMHPVIAPFFFYSLLSPLPAIVGTVLGLMVAMKKTASRIPFFSNLVYLVLSTGGLVFLFLRGQSI